MKLSKFGWFYSNIFRPLLVGFVVPVPILESPVTFILIAILLNLFCCFGENAIYDSGKNSK